MPRKKKSPEVTGAPLWLVTFGDLMSLLLTFFVLLLSFSTISEEQFNQAMASLQQALGVLRLQDGVISPIPRPPRRTQESASDAARKLRRELQVMGMEKQVKIEFDAVGGIKISLPNAVLFDMGSTELKPESFPVMQNVAEVLRDMPDAFIEVRGHTDNIPTSAGSIYRDNMQLSFFRADAVARRLFEVGGVPKEQFEITALGSNQPMATNDTPEGREANRRVEIYVRGLVPKDMLDPLRDPNIGGTPMNHQPSATAISPRQFNME